MSLTVKNLNGDTTFLLIFSPPDAIIPPDARELPAGSFTILVDPWLTGIASMWHPKFLLSRHTIRSWVNHLSEIPEPNVVLVSQDKPDHCHEETLRQLDPASPITMVLAEPAAAKRIRGMRHFDPAMVHDLRAFSRKKEDTIIRFCIPPIIPDGTAGEATIAFIPGKMDVAGVHNAIGITYRAPSVTTLPGRPLTPVRPLVSRHSTFTSQTSSRRPLTPPDSPVNSNSSQSFSTITSDPSSSFSMPQHTRSISSTSTMSSMRYAPQTQKSLSVIYSPHGVSYPVLRPYASSHLVATAALPLTALLHSFDRVNNPWWMGGNVAAGMSGGTEIARNLMARSWISAHDEDKDNKGISVANVKKTKHSIQEVAKSMIGSGTQVMSLGVGEEIAFKA